MGACVPQCVPAEGADAAAAVEQCLVARQGHGVDLGRRTGVAGVGLDGEEFAGGRGHGPGEGEVDAVEAAEHGDRGGVRGSREPAVDPHERLEGPGRPLLAPALDAIRSAEVCSSR